MTHSLAELRSLDDRELWRRRSLAAFRGPASVKAACDDEMARRAAIKSGYATKAGYPAYQGTMTRNQTIATELAAIRNERAALAELERRMPRHTRVVYTPGPTAGSMVGYRVEEP